MGRSLGLGGHDRPDALVRRDRGTNVRGCRRHDRMVTRSLDFGEAAEGDTRRERAGCPGERIGFESVTEAAIGVLVSLQFVDHTPGRSVDECPLEDREFEGPGVLGEEGVSVRERLHAESMHAAV